MNATLGRRLIYLFMILVVSIPLITNYTLRPVEMKAANQFYSLVEDLSVGPNDIAFVAFDFGPNTKAENEPQAEVVVEHLLRRRIPFAVFTQYAQAEGFLTSIPERIAKRLMEEMPDKKWEYGQDWVNLGFRPGGALFVQAIAKSTNIAKELDKDAFGASLLQIPAIKNVRTLENVKLLTQFTGLVGVFDTYIQFFQNENYVPQFGHGCTSITIPEAYIYLDSGQLSGLLEGIAGAAWYSELLLQNNPKRAPDAALVINTALGVAHLAVIALIILGNLIAFVQSRRATA